MATTSRLRKYSKLLYLCNKNQWFTKNVLNASYCSSEGAQSFSEKIVLSNGKTLKLSCGTYAEFADGCAITSLGDTTVMVTAVSKPGSTTQSFLPLIVDYRQKAAAAGRIPTNYLRRELGLTDHEILVSRFIDRSLRPMFPKDYYYDTQIVCNMLAVDGVNNPDVISINAASTALALSDIPWGGPVAAVRIGMIDDQLLINPTRQELSECNMNLIVTAAEKNLIVMLEGSGHFAEIALKKAIKHASKECQSIIEAINRLRSKYGKPKRSIEKEVEDFDALLANTKSLSEQDLQQILTNYTHSKVSRDEAINDVRKSVCKSLQDQHPHLDNAVINKAFDQIVKETFRSLVFEYNKRCDGRGLDDLRDIECAVNILKPLHGSASFKRGQTHVFCTVTLDSLESALKLDPISTLISGTKEKNFFLHYEFPPYAVNEIGRIGGKGRREVGHGSLAERGIRPVLPKDYPFTIRLTSEVFSSNGSSSMATVCGASLALLDAGVPISNPVAGVAMGLLTKYDEDNMKDITDYLLLTDILGIEDYLGDMDFKIAGTKSSITALQADIKVPGLPMKVIMRCIQNSAAARSKIIKIMNRVIAQPNNSKGDVMPVTENIEIPVHQRGKFLGVGGMNLKKIFVETGVQINPVDETVYSMFAPNSEAMKEAKEIIKKHIEKDREPTLEFGAIYTAKIVEIIDIGVLVSLYPTMKPTLLPNSQLDQRKIHHPSALGLEVGQELQVKYFGRDPVSGDMRLSRKVLQDPITKIVKSMT